MSDQAAMGPPHWSKTRVQDVGRGSTWVLDPFEKHRGYLGEDAAAWIDHKATLRGEEIAGLTDDDLAARIAAPSPFADLDQARATTALDWQRRLQDAQARLCREQEGALMLEPRGSKQPERHGRTPYLAARRQRVASLEREIAQLGDDPRSRADSQYLHAWVVEHESAVVEYVAVMRERAIRERESRRALDPSHGPEPDPLFVPWDVDSEAVSTRRSIGVGEDVASVIEKLRETRRYWNEVEPDTGARVISRDEVTVTDPLDRFANALGNERTNVVAERARQLASWLEDQPDQWIDTRLIELNNDPDSLDYEAAYEAQRNDRDSTIARRLLQPIQSEIEQRTGIPLDLTNVSDRELWIRVDPDGFMKSNRDVKWCLDQLARLHGREAYLHETDRHPDPVLDLVARQVAYAREHAIRRELHILQQVEHYGRVEPPAYVQAHIGAPPRGDASEGIRREYEALTRDIVYEHLSQRTRDLTDDIPGAPYRHGRPEGSHHHEQPSLDERIKNLRLARGMEELEREPNTAGLEFGPPF